MKVELETAQATLKAANNESASRRIKIKALEEQIATSDGAGKTDLDKANERASVLEESLKAAGGRLLKYDLRGAFTGAARKAEVNWASGQAEDDAFELVYPQLVSLKIDEEGAVDADKVKSIVEKAIKGRDYLISDKEPAPDIDSRKKGEQQPLVTAEAAALKKRQQANYEEL